MDPENAKRTVREYFYRLLNEHDLSVCEELLAPDYIDHDAHADTAPGPTGTREYVESFLAEYPDAHVAIQHIIGEGDTVAARMLWDGTSSTSGEHLRMIGLVMLRLNEAGRIVARWSAYTEPDEICHGPTVAGMNLAL